MSSEVQAILSGLATVGPAGLAFIIVTGALRLWVYGYIDKAKDAQIERLTAALEKSLENNRVLLSVIESAKHGGR